jgi:hypothetical protein
MSTAHKTQVTNTPGMLTEQHAPQFTSQELENINESIKALEKVLKRPDLGKYKIEVMFTSARRTQGPVSGMLNIWESGKQLANNDGDVKVFMCPGLHMARLGRRPQHTIDPTPASVTCQSIIPDITNGLGYLVCPGCQTRWEAEDVIGEVYYNVPIETWGLILLHHFAILGHNADIILKHPRRELQEAAAARGTTHGDSTDLAKVRTGRIVCAYPLRNIIADTSNGSDILSRFMAFLRA